MVQKKGTSYSKDFCRRETVLSWYEFLKSSLCRGISRSYVGKVFFWLKMCRLWGMKVRNLKIYSAVNVVATECLIIATVLHATATYFCEKFLEN
jgi:hypothetical protein